MAKKGIQPHAGAAKGTIAIIHHEGRSYEQRLIDCRKPNCKKCSTQPARTPSHGPYWYLCAQTKSGWRRLYLGKTLNTSLYIRESGAIDWQAYAADRKPRKTPAATAHQNSTNQIDTLIPHTRKSQPNSTSSGSPTAASSSGEASTPQGGQGQTTATPSHLRPLFPKGAAPGSAAIRSSSPSPEPPGQLDFFAVDPDDPYSEYLPHPCPPWPSSSPEEMQANPEPLSLSE